MRLPIEKPIKTCYEVKNEILGISGTLEDEKNQLTNALKESFSKNLGYDKVKVNNSTDFVEVCIYDDNATKEDVFYKMLWSYPYDDIQFSRGDYIYWRYGNQDTAWLLETLDEQHLYDIRGRIYKCNHNLKWQDENLITRSYPCVLEDKVNNNVFDINKNIIIQNGFIYVDVQQNEITSKIKVNQRFLFDGQAFKVNFVETFIGGNYMSLTLAKDEIAPDDKVDLGIANYKNIIVNSGVIQVEPNTTSILQGKSQTYIVKKLINGVDSGSILTIQDITSGISSGYYTFSSGVNSFTVNNLKMFNGSNVRIKVSDGSGNEKIFEIKLKGAW